MKASTERMIEAPKLDLYQTAGSSPPATYPCGAARCHKLIPVRQGRGRPRLFCSNACRLAQNRLLASGGLKRQPSNARPSRPATRTVTRFLSPRTRPEPAKAGDRAFVLFMYAGTGPVRRSEG